MLAVINFNRTLHCPMLKSNARRRFFVQNGQSIYSSQSREEQLEEVRVFHCRFVVRRKLRQRKIRVRSMICFYFKIHLIFSV